MTAAPLYQLDTNMILAYVRFGALGQYVEATYSLYTVQPSPIISVVTEGEIRALALKRGWGHGRVADMERLLSVVTVVPIPFGGILDAYACVDAYCEKNGLSLSKNDLWIAATAHVTRAILLTSDADFNPLEGVFLSRLWVDPARHL